jgi:hypothetical protein
MALLMTATGCACATPDFPAALRAAQWKVRDVAAGSKYASADSAGQVPDLGMKLEAVQPTGQVWASNCTVTDKTGRDRAVTLALCIPLDARGGVWWDNPGKSRRIAGKGVYAELVDNGLGATGFVSRYPLAVVSTDDASFCLALPVDKPNMARLVYDAGRRELRAEFDFGLSKLCDRFPSRADATAIAWVGPAKWPMRQAIERYWQLYPDAFARRVKRAGIWLPFSPLGAVERPEDFGFAFRETTDSDAANVKQDHALGVHSFVYTEPMTVWRAFRGSTPKSYAGHMRQLTDDALAGDEIARAVLTSGAELADGKYFLYLDKVAYTPMSPFGVNPDPNLPTDGWPGWPNRAQQETARLSKALGWSGDPNPGYDGIYVDSMESGWSLGDYNRDHWRATRHPLTFDPAAHRLCLANFWGTYEFIRTWSDKLRAKGMWLMGNDAFYRFWFLAPYVDVPGREYSWYEGGKFTPPPDDRYFFFRAMSARKPYLMLMNNKFDDGASMEEYFQRSLFWGVYPSMFHGHASEKEVPYFANPDWYNRDRELFRKYVPLIRKLDEAGWEPVPYAVAEPASVRIERWGRAADGNLAFTLRNPTARPLTVRLLLDREALGLPASVAATDWLAGRGLPTVPSGSAIAVSLRLAPKGCAAVGILKADS